MSEVINSPERIDVEKDGNTSSLSNGFDYSSLKIAKMRKNDWSELKEKKKQYKQWKQEKLLKKLQRNAELEEIQRKKDSDSQKEKEKGRLDCTVSIAVPGTILDICQSLELKSYVAGQIARAAAIYRVNEIIVFNEKNIESIEEGEEKLKLSKECRGSMMMMKILQYLECPQYLRKYFFPIHSDLHFAGLLNPLDLPHHLRVDEESTFREGVVINKPVKAGKGSYVYIGLKKTAKIDKELKPNTRVTVHLNPDNLSKKHFIGKAVSPMTPLRLENCYWGYTVRFAEGLNSVISKCPFKGGYDVTIGTSEKGQSYKEVTFPSYRHLLIVFGGVKGLEACLEGDETITATEPKELFNHYINICPSQGSRTIRTEEAVFITMAALTDKVSAFGKTF
ncbi:putative methyltransferase C9orf114 homolog [Nephila pilipes]|uniref:28S rRNA (uridine-N(3))-methyltransferase n=1 Tax=Nephila pilipes TaxID=299642 RepID=A0A8X6QH10_NEPPI|nr:putative methyltransferase C9orf114 homolog [Nephila pilipes]